MQTFNLTSDPWIPVVYVTGQSDVLSLGELFAFADEIRDLAVNPYERIAVMRLLACVTHAALEGPANRKAWKSCRAEIAPAVTSYLERWHEVFSLSGSSPFLQVPDLTLDTTDSGRLSVSKLNFALASENNPTLFDNAGGELRKLGGARIALSLLSHQNFSTCGTIGVGKWGGQTGTGTSFHAPCVGTLHAILIGSTLLETLHLNLLNQELVAEALGENRWGKPVWEQMPASLRDEPAVKNSTTTYLGRLVPLSRAILLRDDRLTMTRANGLGYPDYATGGWREPSATIVTAKKDGKEIRKVLSSDFNRASWRELHSLTVKRISQKGTSGPLALDNLADDTEFDLWCGALVPSQAKVLGSLESVFSHVPATMLDPEGQRIYQNGIQYAERFEGRLKSAISTYHTSLGDDLNRPEAKDRRGQWQRTALSFFWSAAEQSRPLLLDLVRGQGSESDYGATAWGQAVKQAAHRAYEDACPRDTARQMRAFVAGLNEFSSTKTN